MKDIEEFYIEGVEKEGETFLDGLNNKKSLAELEKEYSKKVKEIRKIYEKSMKKELEKEKDALIKSAKKKGLQKKEGEKFEPKGFDLNKSWYERKKIEIYIGMYNLKRKLKNSIKIITPNKIIFLYYKLGKNTRYLFKKTRTFLENTWKKFSEKVLNAFNSTKNGIIKFFNIINEKVSKLRIKKNKKEDSGKKIEEKNNAGKQGQ